MDNQNKNLILATALSFLVVLGWFVLFPPEEMTTPPPAQQGGEPLDIPGPDIAAAPPAAGIPATHADAERAVPETVDTIRIPVETSRLVGSISLQGGRIDDLLLSQYRQTLEDDSELVRLLSPVGTSEPYYALFGWAPAGSLDYSAVPGASTEWQLESGSVLTPGETVTLVWNNGEGLTFRRTLSIGDGYMLSVSQSVVNEGSRPVRLAPYGVIARHGEPDVQGFFILHEGVVQMTDSQLEETDYSDVPDLPFDTRERANLNIQPVSANGWIGFTDKYWMLTLIPRPGQPFDAVTKYSEATDIFQTEARMPTVEVAPRESYGTDTLLFAGAKEWELIKGYEDRFGIERFVDSIDWGWFFFLTKPIFLLLHWLNAYVGNMGWSIICLTFIIKAVLFPLAYKSYVSMAKMKELQPEMEKIKEQTGDDRKELQRQMMELYKTRKINPAAGCLPILPQIPIFFSLYKVIFVTIEMRHAPFIWWIRDLSVPDPTSILNLFGALPWGAPDPGSLISLISLGVLPILLGISMWLQQKLNPAPTDPTQAAVFAWMPWIFMFMLGQFASGLIIYWIANNMITFAQQYVIMRSQGVKPDILGNIITSFRKKEKKEPVIKQRNSRSGGHQQESHQKKSRKPRKRTSQGRKKNG
ncbi:MAG: membrane protein insertase YidC [Rhodobacteraceae bacterium]|nr:membrane protein insertase YidC [Paracoccaceae bacterium]